MGGGFCGSLFGAGNSFVAGKGVVRSLFRVSGL